MSLTNLQSLATRLPNSWQSMVFGSIGRANLKVVRMDGAPYPQEVHSYPEGLLVIEGRLQLVVAGEPVAVTAGEIFIVPAGVPHWVAAGSAGTLVILDE